MSTIKDILLVSLFISMVLTGYVFVQSTVLKNNEYKFFYNSWQFPMLLAIFIDLKYGSTS